MIKIHLKKSQLGVLAAIALSASSMTGCSIANQESYPIILEEMEGYEDEELVACLNGISFSNEQFREAVYNSVEEDPLKDSSIGHGIQNETILNLSNITDTYDLKLFKNLKVLSISDSSINDLSSLGNTKLNRIEFNNMIVDASILNELNVSSIEFFNCDLINLDKLPKNMEYLGIYFSRGGSLKTIGNYKQLKGVNLDHADVEDISSLSDTKLVSLNIYDCNLEEWAFLNEITSLKELDVSYTNFDDINDISNLTDLESLRLAYCHIPTLSGVENLKKLNSLDITSCSNLKSYEELVDLKKLEYLDITNLEMIYNKKIANKLQSNGVTGFDISDDLSIQNKIIELYNSIGITNDMSEEEKVRKICLKVLDQMQPDPRVDEDVLYNYNRNLLYNGINGLGVCNNYSALTHAFFDLAGLDNYIINGEIYPEDTSILHVWNIVKVNGEWVGVDNTFIEGINGGYEAISNGEYCNFCMDKLDNEIWNGCHQAFYVPDEVYSENFNLAK